MKIKLTTLREAIRHVIIESDLKSLQSFSDMFDAYPMLAEKVEDQEPLGWHLDLDEYDLYFEDQGGDHFLDPLISGPEGVGEPEWEKISNSRGLFPYQELQIAFELIRNGEPGWTGMTYSGVDFKVAQEHTQKVVDLFQLPASLLGSTNINSMESERGRDQALGTNWAGNLARSQ